MAMDNSPPRGANVDDKRDIVLEQEIKFARHLAYKVVDAPSLHVWMILIPFIFVVHFMRLNRAKEARQKFTEGYMMARRQALDAVWEALRADSAAPRKLTGNRKTAMLDELCAASAVPQKAMANYRALVDLLVVHYWDMLHADGSSYPDLLRAVYGSRKGYLHFIRDLNTAEIKLNTALKPHLPEEVEGAQDVVALMERTMSNLRKEQAKEMFA